MGDHHRCEGRRSAALKSGRLGRASCPRAPRGNRCWKRTGKLCGKYCLPPLPLYRRHCRSLRQPGIRPHNLGPSRESVQCFASCGKPRKRILRSGAQTCGRRRRGGARLLDEAAGVGSASDKIYSGTRPLSDTFPELDQVNPHFVEDAVAGTNTNCVSCVIATQKRLSGVEPAAVAGP